MTSVADYAEKHFPQFMEKLKALSRIPSISFDGFPKESVEESARAVATLLKEEGLENVEILTLPGAHPYVYADWLHAGSDKPTLLLYAHHDVQPPGKEELWKSPPFEPTERDGRLFGRGTADDKAGILVHTSAIASYLRTVGKLPVNVKLLIEGEEEIGSGHLEQFLEKYREKMKADVIVLTDTSNYDIGIPTITTSLRGIVIVEFEVRATRQSLHSGSWGGPVADPAAALCKILASLHDADGRIAIPGMYDQVKPLNDVEKKSFASLNYTEEEFRKQSGLLPGINILGGKLPLLEKMWRQPSLTINAMEASSRKGKANIITEAAWAKVSVRTVPDMQNEKVKKSLCDFLKAQAPWGVEVHILETQSGPWWATDPSGPVFEKARTALTKAFGREAVFAGQGGSIPFVTPFSAALKGAPALLIGVEDPYTNAHSENESLHLGDMKKSILAAIYLYEGLAQK